MDLSNVDLLSLQTSYMKLDPTTQALCSALQPQFRQISDEVKACLIFFRINELDEPILDELALQMHIDWYDSSSEVNVKRNLIKDAIKIHRYRGTPYAVEEAVRIYFGPGYVQEWFEYDGPPFEFKVLTTNKAVTDETYQEFIRITKIVKNVRSHLEGVYYYGIYTTPFPYGNGVKSIVFPFILCGTRPKRTLIGKINTILIQTQTDTFKSSFSFILCGKQKTGVTPINAYTSDIYQKTVKISNAIGTFAFVPIKCGTRKTGEVM